VTISIEEKTPWGLGKFGATVTASCGYQGYETIPDADAPALQFDSSMSGLTRERWELLKRLADKAFDEYERRYGPKESR
jgi:hypothetical protein